MKVICWFFVVLFSVYFVVLWMVGLTLVRHAISWHYVNAYLHSFVRLNVVLLLKLYWCNYLTIFSGILFRGVTTGWTGVVMSIPLLPEVIPEIDANPVSFFREEGLGWSRSWFGVSRTLTVHFRPLSSKWPSWNLQYCRISGLNADGSWKERSEWQSCRHL